MRKHLHPAILLTLIFSMLILFNATLEATAEQVDTFIAAKATSTTTLIGFTRARARMKLISQVSDKIRIITADVGDSISKDGVFAKFDTTLPELEIEYIRINQDKIKSRISYLEKEANRFRVLLEKHSTAEAKLDSLIQDLDQANLSLREFENSEKKATEHLERHIVKAPQGWQVINRHVEPGERVTAGTPLADVGDYRVLSVPYAVSQEEYLWLKDHRKDLILHLPELSTSIKARLKHFSPGFDPVTRKLNIELEIVPPKKERRGGIRAELSIDIPDPSGAILVPDSAITSRYDSSWLKTAEGDKIQVIVLGPAKSQGFSRITSPETEAGDIFLTNPNAGTTPYR